MISVKLGPVESARPSRTSAQGRPAAWRTTVAASLICAAGLALAHATTDGFQAYTLESARRLHALQSPVAVPDLVLEVVGGERQRVSEIPGRVLLVDFVYTSCPTLCAALGSVYTRLQRRLAPEIASGEVRLLSISFDPERDGLVELDAYRARHSPDHKGWDVGRPAHRGDLKAWLTAFGVVVIPDTLGGYVHNAAVHVIGPERKLVAILDPEDLDGIVRATRKVIGGTVRDGAEH